MKLEKIEKKLLAFYVSRQHTVALIKTINPIELAFMIVKLLS
ncbi:MAG: hypothetical protein ACTS77_04540 [Arsenophonus sp. NC-TX2-MAG3]